MSAPDHFTVGIVGLGLIGGSLARAYTEAGHTVLGLDADPAVTDFAILDGAVAAHLTPDTFIRTDVIFLSIMPEAVVRFLEENAAALGGCLVIDCAGTKRGVCEKGFAIAKAHGFTFIGGHPMAGSHKGGYKNSRATLYHGASMIVVPHDTEDIALLDHVREIMLAAGFAGLTVCSAAEHDRTIAYTSQLAHAVSSAYVKSPTAEVRRGFSAGSFRDMTRVAYLNPTMWTELFLDNAEPLCDEIDGLCERLKTYSDAIRNGRREELFALLKEGRDRKEFLEEREK